MNLELKAEALESLQAILAQVPADAQGRKTLFATVVLSRTGGTAYITIYAIIPTAQEPQRAYNVTVLISRATGLAIHDNGYHTSIKYTGYNRADGVAERLLSVLPNGTPPICIETLR